MIGRPAPSLILVALLILTAAPVPAQPAEDVKPAAAKLAEAIRKAGLGSVGVLPVVFEEDRPVDGAAAPVARGSDDRPANKASASPHARLLVERMEIFLAEAAGGDFRVVPSRRILERIEREPEKAAALASSGDRLGAPLRALGEGVEGVVVGHLVHGRKEDPDADGGLVRTDEILDVAWKLVDLADGSIRGAATDTRRASLADAVYRGQSGEFFRWEGDRLKVLHHPAGDRPARFPLGPGEPERSHLPDGVNRDLNPLLNPNCPYKVGFTVDDVERPVLIAIDDVGGQTPPPERIGAAWGGHAFLPVEPGETPVITVRNTTGKRAMVAVLVDGVNILGKARELPDERCRAWVIDPGVRAKFRGWYSGEEKATLLEKFVVTSWEDTIAGRLGLPADAAQSQLITVVVFHEGWPTTGTMSFFPKRWEQAHWWDPRQGRIGVWEGIPEQTGTGSRQRFGLGGLKPEPVQLQWVPAKTPGTILAAMTVLYGPRTEAQMRMEHRLGTSPGAPRRWTLVETLPTGSR